MHRSCEADRRDEDEGADHRGGKAVEPVQGGAAGDPVREDDVRREQAGVGEAEQDPDRLRDEADVGQQVHTARRRGDRGEVASHARAGRGQRDRPDELDRGDRRERQVVDRDVEAGVHDREDGAERDEQRAAPAVEGDERPPGPPPESEDDGRRGDPQPGDARADVLGEEQDGERGAEVVEERAPGEVRLRRHGRPTRRGDLGPDCDGPILPRHGLDGHSESKALGSSDDMNDGVATGRGGDRPRLDDIDRKILGELSSDGRVSIAELGRRVNLSSPAVAERVQRLERSGVITGYRAEIDPRALGYQLTAIVRIKPAAGRLPRIPELALEVPQVVECHRITGEDCFYLKVYLRSIDELSGLLDQFLVYGETTTSIVNSTPIPLRDPPLSPRE